MLAKLKGPCVLIALLIPLGSAYVLAESAQATNARDNGDVYVVRPPQFNSDENITNTSVNQAEAVDDLADAVMQLCNASFSIPMDYLVQFNNTGELPNVIDKTAMCYIRCFYEKFGLIDNWRLNVQKIREYMWPAMGDTIEYCQLQGKSEPNACVRSYAIAKCLALRAIVDARNKPVV